VAVVAENDLLVSVNPAQWEDVITEQPSMTDEDVRRISAGLRARGVRYSNAERSQRLRDFARLLTRNALELADLIIREVAKLRAEAEAEVAFASQIAAHYADRLDRADLRDHIRSRPVRLAGVVTPFNFPCSISVMKVCAAFGAGAPILWKPSPHTIGVAARIRDLAAEAFGDVLVTVPTASQSAFEEVVKQVDALSFTGGSGGAGILWRVASEKPIPMQLELGSCNATIVGPSYGIEEAASILRVSVYSYAGQKCSSTRRILIDRPRAQALFAAMADGVRSERVGDPRDALTTVPPLVAPANANRFRSAMDAWGSTAVRHASTSLSAPVTPCFVDASISLADLDQDIFRAEVFGPAAVILPYNDFNEAITVANATSFGLFCGLLTHDPVEAEAFESQARAGILKINQTTTGLMVHLPSQGWDASGIGPGELGPDPFRPFQRTQTIYPYELDPR
jgi:alpha-ketoglutaric semialdehyde dehydrogenase